MFMTTVWSHEMLVAHGERCMYKLEDTRTYMYGQTDGHSGWISEIVAAHTLANVVRTRTPLRCGWAAVGTCMHTCMCMHACLSLSFFLSFRWQHCRLYAPLMCMNVSVFCLSTFMSMHDSCQHTRERYTYICFLFVWFSEYTRQLSG